MGLTHLGMISRVNPIRSRARFTIKGIILRVSFWAHIRMREVRGLIIGQID